MAWSVAWSAAGSVWNDIGQNGFEPLGSWTVFRRLVSNSLLIKCIQNYLSVSPTPPDYPICKQYLDNVTEIILNDLALSPFFKATDEAMYSKLCHILWKHQNLQAGYPSKGFTRKFYIGTFAGI